MANFLKNVLHAFSQMDSLTIKDLLDPQNTYQDLEKNLFIEKLESIFEEFRSEGTSNLSVLEGACFSLDCNPTQNRTTYRFFSEKTRDYIDFRFILDPIKLSNDYAISDIYQCHCFKCHTDRNTRFGEEKILFIYWDEKNDFSKDADFLIYREIANEGLEKLKTFQGIINLEEIGAWLMKYQSAIGFIERFKKPPIFEKMKWDRFTSIYRRLKDFFEVIPKVVSLFQSDFEDWGKRSEDEMIECILRFENLFWETKYDYFFNFETKDGKYLINSEELILKGEVIDKFNSMWSRFLIERKRLVKKYFSLSDGELDQYYESNEYYFHETELERLGFHMEIRDRAKKNGEIIPLR